MKTTNTLFLLVVAAAVGGAIYYVNQQEQEIITSAAIPVQSIPGVTSSTIQRVTIHAPGEKPVILTRADDKWFTNVEKQYAADPSAISSLLGALDKPIEAQVVSSNKDSYGDYQVDETSGVKVQVFEKAKDSPALDMIVGKDGPSAFSTYVRHADEDDVLNAKASLSMAFKRPDGWRNKQIFEFTGANATRIEATGTSQTFTIARQDDKWMFEVPEKTEADTARIDSMANMLSSLRANEFIDPASSQTLADFGLEPPRQTINLSYEDKSSSPSQSKSVTLYIGNEAATSGDWYAKRKDRNDIFTIGQSVADALLPAPNSLFAPKPEPPPTEETTATITSSETTATEETTVPESIVAPETEPAPTPVSTPVPAPEPTPVATPTPEPAPSPQAEETATTPSETNTPAP